MKKTTLIIIIVLTALVLSVGMYLQGSRSQNYTPKDSLGPVNPGVETTSDGIY